MKKRIALLLAFLLLVSSTGVHIHNDKCGYNPETKVGCSYEIDLLMDKDPIA